MVQRKPSTSPSGDGRRDRPVRTCIGCRHRAEAPALVRLVARQGADGSAIVVDLAKTMPGRGAWLHPRADCVSAAMRRRAFGPALRAPGLVVGPDDLADVIGAAAPSPTTDDSRPENGPEQVAEDMSTA
ncbi:YlxR family protein [Gordonia sp. DT30]|uniref:YlxR family protein n=1 Tax=unclassified Gordonia (in: high G+C Gram-positive bacteria) TaxID=2657482 RepID=UPI003CE8FB31